MKLNKRQENMLRMIVEELEVILPSYSKTLQALHDAGFVFVKDSENSVFGDKSVLVRSSLDGEDYLSELDGE